MEKELLLWQRRSMVLYMDRFAVRGLQGSSYAIVTKDLKKGVRSIPLEDIEKEVKTFLEFAKDHPEHTFKVSPIGCGLAGYLYWEIASMFEGATDNVILPDEFLNPYGNLKDWKLTYREGDGLMKMN